MALRFAFSFAAPDPGQGIGGERQSPPAVTSISQAEDAKTEGGNVFWIYWDTAWSLIISGIMFTTIVTHPDAEFVEIQAARRAK